MPIKWQFGHAGGVSSSFHQLAGLSPECAGDSVHLQLVVVQLVSAFCFSARDGEGHGPIMSFANGLFRAV